MRGGLGLSGEGPSPWPGLQGESIGESQSQAARPSPDTRGGFGTEVAPAREGRAWLPGMHPFPGRGLCRPGSGLCGRDRGARQDPGAQGAGGDRGRRQALKTEDDGRWGDRQACGKHLRKGTAPGCADGFCWEGHSHRSSGRASGGRGEVSWQGSGP